ncbi:hypothetical protein FRC01_014765 [Tulasnella sp. 417]|nr:hypothetical protein FRC01_014765 [Tulasnella sp. 417]
MVSSLSKTTETTSLLDVDRETDVVTAAQELFSSILAPRLLELRRQHNTLLPINSLPAETLAYIISISVHSQLWSVSTISCLASVCTRWWQIILTTPSLWATARLFEKPELAIRMSKEAPLTIFVPHGHHLGEEMKEFIDITGPYIHRWQSVSIQTPFIDYVFAYLTYPLPGLKELHIGYVGSLGERRLVLGATPELRHLRLSRIAMAWEALADLSLETLSLSHLQIQGPSMQQLYQILASSPHLTKLTLVDLEDPIGAAGFQAEVLSLKRLCSVEIRHIGQHTLTGLAKVLQAQTLSSLILAETISPVINTSQLQKILRPSSEDSPLPSVIRNQALNRVYVKTSALGLRLSNKRSRASMSGACLDIDIQGMAGIVLLPAFGAPNRGYDVDLDRRGTLSYFGSGQPLGSSGWKREHPIGHGSTVKGSGVIVGVVLSKIEGPAFGVE